MSRDTTVIRLRQPDAIDDPLTELAREAARRMLGQALIAEALWRSGRSPAYRAPLQAAKPQRTAIAAQEGCNLQPRNIYVKAGRYMRSVSPPSLFLVRKDP
jgi:hypothetical protein